MTALTEKQQAVLALLVQAARQGQPFPTYRQIAERTGVTVRSVFQHITALEKKGVVSRGPAGLQLAPEFAPPRGIPVVGRVAAGLPILAEENIEEYVDLNEVAAGDDDSFLLKVRGDSMVDCRIHDGDYVLVRPRFTLDAGAIGVVSINGEATVKRVYADRECITLVSSNSQKHYPDQIYRRGDDVRIIGKVILAFRHIN